MAFHLSKEESLLESKWIVIVIQNVSLTAILTIQEERAGLERTLSVRHLVLIVIHLHISRLSWVLDES